MHGGKKIRKIYSAIVKESRNFQRCFTLKNVAFASLPQFVVAKLCVSFFLLGQNQLIYVSIYSRAILRGNNKQVLLHPFVHHKKRTVIALPGYASIPGWFFRVQPRKRRLRLTFKHNFFLSACMCVQQTNKSSLLSENDIRTSLFVLSAILWFNKACIHLQPAAKQKVARQISLLHPH